MKTEPDRPNHGVLLGGLHDGLHVDLTPRIQWGPQPQLSDEEKRQLGITESLYSYGYDSHGRRYLIHRETKHYHE